MASSHPRLASERRWFPRVPIPMRLALLILAVPLGTPRLRHPAPASGPVGCRPSALLRGRETTLGLSSCVGCGIATPTAPGTHDSSRRVRITHPFHPLRGREFVLLDERRSADEERVWYQSDDGTARTVPRGWTGLSVADPFEVIAAGRARFRPDDLAQLVVLVAELRTGRPSQTGREV